MSIDRRVDMAGAAHLVLPEGVHHLQPEEAVLEAMVEGWATQQRSRRLAIRTIENRLRTVRRFGEFCNDYPWNWQPADLEEWTVSLLSEPKPVAYSTVRTHQQCLAMFCSYLVEGALRLGQGLRGALRYPPHPDIP